MISPYFKGGCKASVAIRFILKGWTPKIIAVVKSACISRISIFDYDVMDLYWYFISWYGEAAGRTFWIPNVKWRLSSPTWSTSNHVCFFLSYNRIHCAFSVQCLMLISRHNHGKIVRKWLKFNSREKVQLTDA